MSNQNTFIINTVRTPIGKLGGTLSAIRTDDLAPHVIQSLLNRQDIDPSIIDDVIFGKSGLTYIEEHENDEAKTSLAKKHDYKFLSYGDAMIIV